MLALNFPTYNFKIKSIENKSYIWDEIRKKHIFITSEEWVRQHAIQFLIQEKKYPAMWMSIEKQFTINGQHKRADIVVYDKSLHPYIIVECKRPEIKITQETFDQIARYNLSLDAKYLMLTNGLQHFYCQMDFEQETYMFLESLPNY
ncbi:MAG TPA: type I restriction enzyme HsdR N-terminal domain-containing protein [Lutibacter sp.]|nr:type I restriction enzyme HsdR N-terminal domain-containing protein [Lutibacter sp.]